MSSMQNIREPAQSADSRMWNGCDRTEHRGAQEMALSTTVLNVVAMNCHGVLALCLALP